jgi:RNA 2',3'-cyclic 3'-phosphodiesterase
MRIFISMDMPEEVKKEIQKIQDNLPEFRGKFTEPENLHLTLKFLGEISDEKIKKVRENLGEVKYSSFESEINYGGYFDNSMSKKYSRKIIYWLYMSNCEGLQKLIDENLSDLFPKEERFMSHLTIARVKSTENKQAFLKELKNIPIPKMKFLVDSFKLKHSVLTKQGPTYETIEEYYLN